MEVLMRRTPFCRWCAVVLAAPAVLADSTLRRLGGYDERRDFHDASGSFRAKINQDNTIDYELS